MAKRKVKKKPLAAKHLRAFPYAPHDANIRDRVSRYLLFGPEVRTAVFLGFLIALPLFVSNPIFDINNLMRWIVNDPAGFISTMTIAALCLLMFSVGYFATLLLIVLGSSSQKRMSYAGAPRASIILLVTLVFGAVLVWFGRADWDLPFSNVLKALAHFILVFPYKFLISWLASESRKKHSDTRDNGLWAPRSLILPGLIAVISLVENYLGGLLSSVLSLGLIVWVGIIELLRLDRRYRTTGESKYLLIRVFHKLMDIVFGKSIYEVEEEVDEEVEPPQEAVNVTRSVDDFSTEDGKLPDWADESSRFDEQSPDTFFGPEIYKKMKPPPHAFGEGKWSTLFGINQPTNKQDQALNVLFSTMSTASAEDSEHPDLLLEGERGTGKTTVALAAAVGSVLIRREHAVLFVPSSRDIEEVLSRLVHIIEDGHLTGLVNCSSLRDPRLPQQIRDGEVLPHIQVGTITDFQNLYFDTSVDASLREFGLRQFGMMILDGLDEFTTEDRVQAPFVLQKVRLVQKALRGDVQFLITTYDNHSFPALQNYIWRRLITPLSSSARVVRLDRFGALPTSIQHVSLRDPLHRLAATVEICQDIHPSWGKIILVRPDVDDSVRETEQNALLNDLGQQVDVTVIRDGLPFVLQAPNRKEWIVVIDDGTEKSREIALSLNWSPFARKMKYITFGGSHTPPDVHRHIPVIGSSHSQGRWLPHLNELCQILQPDSPIERDAWVQFGLPEVGAIPPIQPESEEELENTPRLQVDPIENDSAANRASSTQGSALFPWVAVKGGRHSGIVYFNKSAGCRLVQGEDESELVVAKGKDPHPMRIAEWRLSGQGLLEDNHIDLASMSTFDLVHGGSTYTPRTITIDQSSDGRRQRVIIEADDMRSKNGYRFPAWEWEGKLLLSEKHAHFQQKSTALPNTQWFEIRDPEFKATRWVNQSSTWELHALYRARNAEPLPVHNLSFDAECGLTIINFNSTQPYDSSEFIEAVRSQRSWSTKPTLSHEASNLETALLNKSEFVFLPVVTGALNGAFFRIAKGASQLGRIMAFQNPRGGITLLVLETWSNLGSLGDVFNLFLNNKPLWNSYIRKVETLGAIGKKKAPNHRHGDYRDEDFLDYACCLWGSNDQRDPRIASASEVNVLKQFVKDHK